MVKIFSFKRFYVKLTGIFLFLVGISTAYGVSGVDQNFIPLLTQDVTSNVAGTMVLQPDGKIIIYGNFLNGSGSSIGTYIKRLNTDGVPDLTFNCTVCNTFSVNNPVVQPDTKILIAGFDSTGAKIIRVNSDGSLDPTFNTSFTVPFGFSGVSNVNVLALQSDGKVLARVSFSAQGFTEHHIIRLNTNGSNDTTFTTIIFSASRNPISFTKVYVLPNDKFLLGGTGFVGPLATGFFYRYNANGSRDTSFESPVFTDSLESRSYVGDFDVKADGSIVISGKFTAVNSVSETDVVQLLPAGNVDMNFQASNIFEPFSTYTGQVAYLPDGKILINTINFNSVIPVSPDNRLYRLNADGSVDNTFNPPAELTRTLSWILDSSNKIIVFGIHSGTQKYLRLNTDGTLDTIFNAALARDGMVAVLAAQSDGKVLVAGDFNRVNGILKNNFARINANGTPDPSFDSGTGFDVVPKAIVLQTDGKIIVGGRFSSYNGVSRTGIVRLNADGSLDASFNPNVSSVETIALLPDGKILIGGGFTLVNGVNRAGIAKLNADGSLDNTFAPVFSNPVIFSIFVQSDSKIAVGGAFAGVNGFNRQNFVRLNAEGALDTTLNVSTSIVYKVVQQASSKYLLLNEASLSRLNTDGSVDAGFHTASVNGTLNTFDLQSDGSILVGGNFNSISNTSRRNLARLAANGTLDLLFLPSGANAAVNSIVTQANNKAVVGGNFKIIGDVYRPGIARLNLDPFRVVTDFDYDGDGLADISVFRPSENKWYILRSSDFQIMQPIFAISGDIPVPGDYDGDGKTDIAIFRPSSGDWWYQSSINNAQINVHWGQAGDIPQPSDFNGDGKTDYVVYRPSNSVWYRLGSLGQTSNLAFGIAGDKPLIGDFDGDGKSDTAIYRPSTGDWWYASSVTGQFISVHWGTAGDIPVPGDFDGDGKTDFAVFRPSEGGWYILNSSNGSFTTLSFGTPGDKPIAADYDGDGKTDIAVFRPSTGIWYLLQSTAGFGAAQFGVSTDIPTENAFLQ